MIRRFDAPAQRAEVAVAARDLDGAVDVTLTTGSTRAPDRGALYVAQCAAAVKEASPWPPNTFSTRKISARVRRSLG